MKTNQTEKNSTLIQRKKVINSGSSSTSESSLLSTKDDEPIDNFNDEKHTKEFSKQKVNNNSKFSAKFCSLVCANSFALSFLVRSISAVYNLIWDCDETYNYWEPLHFILYKTGFQTWEYSPVYALRSYLYIYLHALPLLPFKYVFSKITLFYMLRFLFALVSSKCESNLFKALLSSATRDEKYNRCGLYFLLFTLTNVGMFVSSTSYLPSTFSMYLAMMAYSAWLNNFKSRFAILSIGLAVLLGWPFAALLGLPIAIDICFLNAKKEWLFFMKWTLIFGTLVAVPLILFDTYLFGKFVLAPLNIVIYNVFPSNPNMGPDIYGKEPLSYYLLNCVLQFNVLAGLALMAPFLLCFEYFKLAKKMSPAYYQNKSFRLISLAVILWCLVFFTRPHKEERFLYPIYPFVLVLASVTLCHLSTMTGPFKRLRHILPVLVIVLHALVSLMRLLALLKVS